MNWNNYHKRGNASQTWANKTTFWIMKYDHDRDDFETCRMEHNLKIGILS